MALIVDDLASVDPWTPRGIEICADLVDPGRVNIFERWESQAALETFRGSGPGTERRRAMPTVSVQKYDIADVRGRVREGGRVNLQHGATLDR